MNLVMSQFMMGAPSLLQRDLHPQSFAMPPSTLDARGCALDATSTDPWGPSQFLMEELHVYTQTKHCADVLHVLHDALTSRGPQWRRVLKALTTVAYCMRQGSEEVTLFARAHLGLIKQLTRFEYVDPFRLDRGAPVREEAELVAGMLLSPHHQPRSDDAYARYPSTRDHGAAQHPTLSATTAHVETTRSRHHIQSPYAHSALVRNSPPIFEWFPWPCTTMQVPIITPKVVVSEPSCDSTTLATLVSQIEASDSDADDSTWLNIYKHLFLLNASLLTASNETIREWTRHTSLLQRILAASRPYATAPCLPRSVHPHPHLASAATTSAAATTTNTTTTATASTTTAVTSTTTSATAASSDTIVSEVHRLAAEIGGVFAGAGGPWEVRHRARMF